MRISTGCYFISGKSRQSVLLYGMESLQMFI